MQLPHIVASAGLAQPSVPLRSIGAAEAPWGEVARLGGRVAQIAGDRLHLERQKQHYAADTEAHYISSQMEVELATGLNTLHRTETDPDAYRAKAQDLIRSTVESVPSRSDKPLVQQYLQRHLATVIGRHQLQTLHVHDQLFTDRQKALGTLTEENYHQAIGQTPWDDHEAISQIAGRGLSAIEAQVGIYGEAETAKRLVTFKHRVNAEVATRHAHEAPDDFLTKIDSYTGLSSEMRNTLAARAEQRSVHIKREARIEREHYEADLAKQFKKEQDQRVGELEADILNRAPGTLDKIELNGPRGVNILTPGEYVRLRKMWTNPQDAASDKATKEAVIIGITQGTMSAAEVARLNSTQGPDGSALLNDADMKWALEHQRTIARQNQEARDPVIAHKQQEVYRIMNDLLATRGSLLEAMTPLETRARTLRAQFGLEQLNRSVYYGKKEDPQDIMNQVGPGLVRAFQDEFTQTIKALDAKTRGFRYKSRAELDAALAAHQIKQKEYDEQAKTWTQLNEALRQKAEFIQTSADLFKVPARGGR